MYIVTFFLFLSIFFSQSSDDFTKIDEFKKLNSSYQFFLKGNFKKALTEFEKGSTNTDKYNAAYLHFVLKNYQSAATYAQSALNTKGSNDEVKPWAYFLLSEIYKVGDDKSNQLKYLKKAIDESSDYAEFLFELGNYYSSINDRDKAIDAYEDGLNINNEATLYHIKKAKLIEQKSVTEALEYLLDSRENLYPKDEFLVYVGQLYKKTGKTNKAQKSFENYLKMYPNGKFKEAAIAELKRMSINYTSVTYNESENTKHYKVRLGEELGYDVSYLFKLGEMSIKVFPDTVIRNGIKAARVTYGLESGTIGLNSLFEVYIDLETLSSIESILLKRSDERIPEFKTYVFNHKKNEFHARVINENGRIHFIKNEMPHATQDGTGILYYARGLVANKRSMSVTTVIDEEFKLTDVYFRDYLDEEEALGVEDKYFYIDAKAHYKGVAGMNGEARGWFSTDGEFTPLVGKMSIIIGSVRVEIDKRK